MHVKEQLAAPVAGFTCKQHTPLDIMTAAGQLDTRPHVWLIVA
jgi:hypothetical protein